jgi:hypothetical protein
LSRRSHKRFACADEKKSLHALERDTAINLQGRIEFLERLRTIPPEKLIFLDESGVTTSMTRLYGRARRGRRVHEATPGGHWKILTILVAMNLGGMLATMTVEAATDSDNEPSPQSFRGVLAVMIATTRTLARRLNLPPLLPERSCPSALHLSPLTRLPDRREADRHA